MKNMFKLAILVFSFLALVSACGSKQAEPPPPIGVTLTPNSANVHVTQTAQFTATVHNSTNSGVTWSVSGSGCSGATCGTISTAGLYTAPPSVPSPATVTVKATSVADTSKSASATINILSNVVVTVSPSDQFVDLGRILQFTAAVQNAVDSGVTWSVSGAGCNGAECGTISTTGQYTAPLVMPTKPTITITAVSVEEPAVSNSAAVTITSNASNPWTWVSGSNVANQAGVYGTKGTPDPANIPGARDRAVSWIDSSGKLWLFGGGGIDSTGNPGGLNDLWNYDPATLEWTWISGSNVANQTGVYGTKGTADPANVPGERELAVSWIGPDRKLWLFGGWGLAGGNYGHLNDLWNYDPTTLEWTWASGSNTVNSGGRYGIKGIADPLNVPGARGEAVTWTDPYGRLWLFGGYGYDSMGFSSGMLNDLWNYDPATLEWTWVSGSDRASQAGTYGTKGTADPENVPGARYGAVSWIDPNGKLWLFGGIGYDSAGNWDMLNDLWNYDPATLEWAWVSGSNTMGQVGIYGTRGTTDPANVPGARLRGISWIDSNGKLWLFGGNGLDSVGASSLLNDLWNYDPATLKWTWVTGGNTVDLGGIYGTKGTTDQANVPGARLGGISWTDSSDKLWLFGGSGFDSVGSGYLNDLWKNTR